MADTSSLRPKASQETFISLLNLDPAPMETPPDTEKDLPPLPEHQESGSEAPRRPPLPASSSSLGLSGSGSRVTYFLSRVQRYSSYTLSIFMTIHLATTSLVPLATRSVPASESYLLLAREIYQTRLSEPLLVGLPIAAHVASGVALRLLRRSQNLKRYGGATPGVYALHRSKAKGPGPWPALSWVSASGYAFVVVLGAHVLMNRGLPLAVEGDSADIGLAYISHGFARHAPLAWAAYVGLLGVGCFHMVWGCAKWLGIAQNASWTTNSRPTGNGAVDKRLRKRRRRLWLTIHAVAAACTGIWAAGGLGVVARGGLAQGWVGKVYDGLYERVGLR